MIRLSANGIELLSAELSHREIEDAIENALIEEDGGYYYWLVDVYSDRAVYRQHVRDQGDEAEPELYYRRSYVVNDDESVTLGQRVEVRREVEYVDAIRIEAGRLRLVRE